MICFSTFGFGFGLGFIGCGFRITFSNCSGVSSGSGYTQGGSGSLCAGGSAVGTILTIIALIDTFSDLGSSINSLAEA
ncbi:hypothetical protein [Serratia symbiotica]|uniref:hypothetical protein n=1 Tax=Serratia symbiotica TaxID=138074 RepID=UPI003CC87130